MSLHVQLLKEVDELIPVVAGIAERAGGPVVDYEPYFEIHARYRLLLARLGRYSHVFESEIPGADMATTNNTRSIHANLRVIRSALNEGTLTNIEEQIAADVLADLVDHADVLIKGKFMLAAAVVLRAVIEERLRKLCEAHAQQLKAAKPTLDTFKQELYGAQIINKVTMKQVEWMASVGNAAAHNLPEFRPEDVPSLYRDTISLLAQLEVP